MMKGNGANASNVHVRDGWRTWMLMMIASMVETRAGPVRVIWTTECWFINIGGSDGISGFWQMTRAVVVVELAISIAY
jgi:hypothetical protein